MEEMGSVASAPQHLRALEHANRVRLARADLKRRIAEAEVSASHVILECPWEAASMAVGDVLLSQHRWGTTRCRRFLLPFQISERKPVGALTTRQRVALAEALAQGAIEERPRELALAGA